MADVNQFRRDRRALDQHAEPAERIGSFENADRRRGYRLSAWTVIAIAASDVIAIEAMGNAVQAVCDIGAVTGEIITAIAMSEPAAGSDLKGIRTTAVRHGDHYLVNGQKTFISNGLLSDLVVAVCRTDPTAGHKGISLLVVERGMEGFERGRNLVEEIPASQRE